MGGLRIAALAACATLLAGQASAAVMLATYTGTIGSGINESDEFGVGQGFMGLSFTATYTYDTSLASQFVTDGLTFEGRSGGNSTFASPVTTATFTLGGVTQTLASDFYSASIETDGPDSTSVERNYLIHNAQRRVSQTFFGFDSFWDMKGHAENAPSKLNVGFDSDVTDGGGYYYLLVQRTEDDQIVERRSAQFFLNPTHVTIQVLVPDPYALPEPSAWALMLLGFGAAGAGLRARRRATV